MAADTQTSTDLDRRTERRLALVTLVVTCVTAWFSFAYFHIDEYFQVLELTRLKLTPEDILAMPWEHREGMRSWTQPFVYWAAASALGIRDIFKVALLARLMTGLANVGALVLFLRATLPWQRTPAQRRMHLYVMTLAGFLPYLFVRTSSESASMAALTAGFSLLFLESKNEVAEWVLPSLAKPLRVVGAGFLFGLAFDIRFQTAFLTISVLAWLWRIGRARLSTLGLFVAGSIVAVGVGALIDRWGYGHWTFPAWSYFRANILEGAAGAFGTDPPFAYLWLLPANVFFPIVVVLFVVMVKATIRHRRHPLVWATVPFVLVHNLLAHKEERFLFPVAVLSLGLVTLVLPKVSRVLLIANFAPMLLLTFVPLGWHHNVRFARFVHDEIGNEVKAIAMPEVDLGLPAFHPRIWDLQKGEVQGREWVITDQPASQPSPNATFVYSELPGCADRERCAALMRFVDRYNGIAKPPLRPLRFRTLFRLVER